MGFKFDSFEVSLSSVKHAVRAITTIGIYVGVYLGTIYFISLIENVWLKMWAFVTWNAFLFYVISKKAA